MVSLASTARAENIVTNPGFETGDLGPWNADASADPTGAEVLSPGRTDQFALHLDAGEFDDFYHVVQDVPATPTDLITAVSIWSYSPTPRWGHAPELVLHYADGSSSSGLFPLVDTWTQFDLSDAVDPGKVLTQVEIDWAGLGDEGPSSEVFIDDVRVDVVPASPSLSLVWLGGVALLRRPGRRAGRPGARVKIPDISSN